MVELPGICDEQCGVFTSAQARRLGWSRHAVQRLLVEGVVVPLRRGVYVGRRRYDTATPVERSIADAIAACLARPGSVISHHSAAHIHDLPLLGSRPAIPALTASPGRGRRGTRDRSVIVHAASLPAPHVRLMSTWAVTTPERTVADLGRAFGVRFTLPAFDSALSRRLLTRESAAAVFDGCVAWPGSKHLLPLLRLADGRAESPYETLARSQLFMAGVPAVPQVWCYDRGGAIGCGDLWVPGHWAFVEVDGDVKYTSAAAASTLLDEKLRQERMEEAGFGVARIAARQVRDRDLLIDKLTRAGARGTLSRSTSRTARGFIGPPPAWADRGSMVPITYPS